MINARMMTGQRWKTLYSSDSEIFIIELVREEDDESWRVKIVQSINGSYYNTIGREIIFNKERFKHSSKCGFLDLRFEYLPGQDRIG